MATSTLFRAFSAPFAFGLAIDGFGARTLWLSNRPGLTAFAALKALPARAPPRNLPSPA